MVDVLSNRCTSDTRSRENFIPALTSTFNPFTAQNQMALNAVETAKFVLRLSVSEILTRQLHRVHDATIYATQRTILHGDGTERSKAGRKNYSAV